MSPPSSAACGLALLAVAALPLSSRAQSAVLYGTLLRDSIGHPLADATIEVPRLHRVVRSDSLGNFKIDRVPAGQLDIIIRHIGYNRLDGHISVDKDVTYLEQYVLEEWPVIIEGMNVETPAKRWRTPGLNEFEERRQSNIGGYFIGDDLLSTTTDHSLQSLLTSRFPHMESGSHGYFKSGRLPGDECPPILYIDGILAYSPAKRGTPPDLGIEDPSLYSGIEFYPDGASAPPQYNTLGSGCGVLLLWSRERITTP